MYPLAGCAAGLFSLVISALCAIIRGKIMPVPSCAIVPAEIPSFAHFVMGRSRRVKA